MTDLSLLEPITSRISRISFAVKKTGDSPKCIRASLKDVHIEKHLNGEFSIGGYPIIAGSSETKIALLDLDSHKGETPWEEMVATARTVSEELLKKDIITIPWRSSGGHGIHLYMLWDTPQDAYSVRETLRKTLEILGFRNGTKGVEEREIEIFPKQDSVQEDGVGNMFILPLANESLPINRENWKLLDRQGASSVNWQTSRDVEKLFKKERPKRVSRAVPANLKLVKSMLRFIPADDRNIWIKVGMALHYETGGSIEGLNTWDEWSAKSDFSYEGWDDVEATWDTFSHNNKSNLATAHSIKLMASENGWVEDVLSDFENLDPEESREEILHALSYLELVDYDTRRKECAEKLGIRVSTLDREVQKLRLEHPVDEELIDPEFKEEFEQWKEPVSGDELLNEIYTTIGQFIVCDERTQIAATLWIAFTWIIDHVNVAPIAMITAPEKRCGKSQLLALMSKLVRKPTMASNISPAAIFRVIDAYKPTLLIDEVDTFMDNPQSEITGIINSGHTKDSAYVIRLVGDDHVPAQFSTWGAKALAGIGKRAETIEDRSINLELRRKLQNEQVERLRHADDQMFSDLAMKLARFSNDHGEEIGVLKPDLPSALHDRAQDNWEPLLAIADFVGEGWPSIGRKAALEISNTEKEAKSAAVEMLQDIRNVFEKHGGSYLYSAELTTLLCEDGESRWNTHYRGGPITPRGVASILKGFDIRSRDIREGADVRKGYKKTQFEDAFARYLSEEADQTLQAFVAEGLSHEETATSSATTYPSATANRLETQDSSAEADDFSDLC